MADQEYEVEVDLVDVNGYTPIEPEDDRTPEQKAEDQAKEEQAAADSRGEGEKNPKKRRSRLKERVDELTRKHRSEERERIRVQEELEQRNQQFTEREQQFQKYQNDSVKVVYQTLDQNRKILEANLKYARERGDTDAEAQISDQLVDARTRMQQLKSHYPDADQPTSQPQPRQQQQPQQEQLHGNENRKPEQPAQKPSVADVPEAGRDWVDANPWLRERNDLHELVNQHDGILRAKGLDPSKKEFYEELTKRLKSDFPEDAAKQLVAGFDYGDDDDPETDNDDDDGQEQEQEQAPAAKQEKPSSNGMSSSGRSAPSNSRKQKVKLTREDQDYCRRNNIDPQAFAKQKLLAETRKNANGYTEIN